MAERPEQPPLAGNYWGSAVTVLLALCPNIVLSTAFAFMRRPVIESLHVSQTWLQVVESLSNAGYAFGAVLAAYLVQRYKQRPLFLWTEGAFVLGSLCCAAAWGGLPFAAGRIIEGFTTGLMLVISLPPLTTQYPLPRLPLTAAVINIGLFGAVTIGPMLGGVSASVWRWLFAGAAVLGVLGMGLAALSIKRLPPFNAAARPSFSAFIFAALGTALPFFGAAQLESQGFSSPLVWAPLSGGLAALAALITEQYRRRDPLIPVKRLATSLPVNGTVVASAVGAAFVALLELTATWQMEFQGTPALAAGLGYWPLVPGVVVATWLYRRVFMTRYIPLLVLTGLGAVIAGGAVMTVVDSPAALRVGTALIGYGAGASVGPGLLMAALGVQTRYIGRAFALVELLRSEATFIIGPIFMHVARSDTASFGSGIVVMLWAAVGIVVLAAALVIAIYFKTGTQLRPPDFEAWLGGDAQALHSPSLIGRR